jgi:transposase
LSAALRIVLPCGTALEVASRAALPLAAELLSNPAPPMLTLSGSLRVFLALEPCDMRKSFDGLHAEVVNRLGDDPRSGAVFVFINRSRNLLKLLHWDGTGLWVHAKRLERGTYRWPKPADAKNGKLSLEPAALAMLTDGIDLRDGMRRAWFERE